MQFYCGLVGNSISTPVGYLKPTFFSLYIICHQIVGLAE